MSHLPIWPSWTSDFVYYNFYKDYTSGIVQFASILKQLQCKNRPISESENLVHTTLQYYCRSGK